MAKKTMRKSRSRLTRRSHTKSGGGLKQWLEARKSRKNQKKMEAAAAAAASIISPKNITPEVVTREERLAKLKQARAAKNAALEKEALDALANLDERLSSERKKPYQTNVNVQRMGKLTSKNWPPRKTPSSSSIKRKNKNPSSSKKLSTSRFLKFEKINKNKIIKRTGAFKRNIEENPLYEVPVAAKSSSPHIYNKLNPRPSPLYNMASLREPSYASLGNDSLNSNNLNYEMFKISGNPNNPKN